jgi:hypothetical protein
MEFFQVPDLSQINEISREWATNVVSKRVFSYENEDVESVPQTLESMESGSDQFVVSESQPPTEENSAENSISIN